MKHPAARDHKSREHAQGGGAVHAPVLKLRQLSIGILCVVVLIMWPMFMVWKQIYITNVSIRESALVDTLVVLTKEAATLRLYNEKLAGTQRIESIARAAMGLDYPTSDQIVVVRESKKGARQSNTGGGSIMAIFRKTFSRERG
jgi:cell division protein FtsL